MTPATNTHSRRKRGRPLPAPRQYDAAQCAEARRQVRQLLYAPEASHDRYVETIRTCMAAGLRVFVDGISALLGREAHNLDPQPTRDWLKAELVRQEGLDNA